MSMGAQVLLSIAALCLLATAGHALECHIERVGGVPTFVINGKPHPGTCYSTYDTHPPRLAARAEAFGEAGCDIYNFVVEISGYGYSRPMWAGPDEWDFGNLDERAKTILDATPEGMLLPRIYIDAPIWWCEAHPEEMMLLDDGSASFGEKLFALAREGNYPSLASERWRQDMVMALGKVIDHVEASDYGDRVIGYQLSGQKTEEWYHWSMNTPPLGDYSSHMVDAYRRWLADRYGDDDTLRHAWSQPDARIATAEIPSREARYGDQDQTFRDPVAEAAVVDFHRFWQWIMVDTIEHFAHAVKVKTNSTKIVGAFYSYTFEFTELAEDAGHLGTGTLQRSPDIDFIMAPSSYFDRNLPGKPYFRAPIASLQHHGKVFWNDFDQVSYKYYDKLKDDPNLKTWEYQMGLTQTPEEFVWMNRREVGMELGPGVQLAHFDIHGGYYDNETIMAGVRELIDLRREALDLPERGSRAQILLLVDEDSEHYYSFRNPIMRELLSEQIAQMPFVAPYDTALLSDLPELDTSRYRLVLVLNSARVTRAMRKTIARKLKRGQKTLIWCHAPGYIDEDGADVDNIADLTGIRVRTLGEGDRRSATASGRGRVSRDALKVPRGLAFCVDDDRAESLARLDDGTVVAGRRDLDEWTSIFTAAIPLRAALLKQVAREAGVHIYCDDPDIAVFANEHYVTACNDGRAEDVALRLPGRATVSDAVTGEALAQGADSILIPMRSKEVRILALR